MQILFFVFIAILLFVIYILSSKEEEKVKSKYEHRGKLKEYWTVGKEQRRTQRFNITLDVSYKLLRSSQPNASTSSKDISEGGICIQSYEILPKGTPLETTINVPKSKEPVSIKGRVAWCEEVGQLDKDGKRTFSTGIEFLEMDKKQRERLLDYINSISAAQLPSKTAEEHPLIDLE